MQDMEQIYTQYFETVNKYLFCLTHNNDISEELTQETFYKAIKGIKKFNNEYKVSTWLCKIAKNTWIDYLRKEKKQKIVSIDDENSIEKIIFEKSFENSIDDKSEIISLYKYIHELEEDTREVFYLRLKGEFSFKEIGEILNKSEDWARLTFYRGKIKLKEAMNNK